MVAQLSTCSSRKLAVPVNALAQGSAPHTADEAVAPVAVGGASHWMAIAASLDEPTRAVFSHQSCVFSTVFCQHFLLTLATEHFLCPLLRVHNFFPVQLG